MFACQSPCASSVFTVLLLLAFPISPFCHHAVEVVNFSASRNFLFSIWQQQLLCSAKLAFRYSLSLSVVGDRAVAEVGFAFCLGRSVYCSLALPWGVNFLGNCVGVVE